MKNLARTTLFFTLAFALILGSVAGLFYLFTWINAATLIPAVSFAPEDALSSALKRAVPIALYCSLAFSLSYAARRRMPKSLAASILALLGFLFSGALFWTLTNSAFPEGFALKGPLESLGQPGIILFQGDTQTVPLEDPENPLGAVIIAEPNRPLAYRVMRQDIPLRAPFWGHENYILAKPMDEFAGAARQLETRLAEGLWNFAMYLGSLCLLLTSLGFVFELTAWPLANLFAGVFAFRGVLALQSFLDSRETQRILTRRIGVIIPPQLLTPAILCGLGILILLSTLIIFIVRNKRRRHD